MNDAINAVKQQWQEKLFPGGAEIASGGVPLAQFKSAMHDLEYRIVRDLALEGKRPDGRNTTDLRAVSCAVGACSGWSWFAAYSRDPTGRWIPEYCSPIQRPRRHCPSGRPGSSKAPNN